MRQSRFPNPRKAGDITAVGGDFSIDLLLDAYFHGIFPWPMDEESELPWFCPRQRALLFFDEIYLGRSLTKARKKSELRFTIDHSFEAVIHACAASPRPGQPGTWITEAVISAYTKLHRLGVTHSVEAWREQELVGGIYGVDCAGAFCAESMFFREPYASKLALLYLVDHLRTKGSTWMDIQMLTPHMEKLGAREVSRDDFLQLLHREQNQGLRLFFR